MTVEQYDIGEWVDLETDPNHKAIRQAIHTILVAISSSDYLRIRMIMKGGVLLAIRYESDRFTEDIDFSTPTTRLDFDLDSFVRELEVSLISAVDKLDYGLDCRLQSHKYKPKDEAASYPTLKIKVGYAYKNDYSSHRRLDNGKCSQVVEIDYSLNEISQSDDVLKLDLGGEIYAYSLIELIAEKYRAILQQEVRNRHRRQDAYDLFRLFEKIELDGDEKVYLLSRLIEKSSARGLHITKESMSNPEIIRRSSSQYDQLESEIDGTLPKFDVVYGEIKSMYESLPWRE